MPLKRFHRLSPVLSFRIEPGEEEDRPPRERVGGRDRLAPLGHFWKEWSSRLPRLYDPGPDVTVDEQLVPFLGRCPFRQYMPGKPAKCGIKFWVACEAKSSYAWRIQIYKGKQQQQQQQPPLMMATRVVMDLIEGLSGPRTVTCDNFFTSFELALRLRAQGLELVGTVRAGRPEIPREFAELSEPLGSSRFAVAHPGVTLVSYRAKRRKTVLIMSTALRGSARSSDSSHLRVCTEDRKARPRAVLDYNACKGGMDNLDKLVATYSCRRATARWPLAVFHNVLDISAYNAFVLWRENRPEWMVGKRHKRRLFLEALGKALVGQQQQQQQQLRTRSRTANSPAIVTRSKRKTVETRGEDEREDEEKNGTESDGDNNKRRRCESCPRSKDRKTRARCRACSRYVCGSCVRLYCPQCTPESSAGSS